MESLILLMVVVLVAAFHVHPASAQVAPLTNADIKRLTSMGVSEQTVLAVVRETTSIQLDFSAQALDALASSGVSSTVLIAMHQLLTPGANVPAMPQPSAASGGQTLAGAAAVAAAQAAAAPSAWRPGLSGEPSSKPAMPAVLSTSSATTTTPVACGPRKGDADNDRPDRQGP